MNDRKKALVTGGATGIGRSAVLALAQAGYDVAINYASSAKAAKEVAALAQEMGAKTMLLPCDVSDEAAVRAMMAQVDAQFGHLDALVNNAGTTATWKVKDLESLDMDEWDRTFAVNVRGTFLTSQAAIPHLRESAKAGRNPHILTLSPPLSMKAKWFQHHVAYTMAKYGMSMCVLGMSEEFKKEGIAVNALWPRTAIDTAALQMIPGVDTAACRTPEILADAAYIILNRESKGCTGNFFVDDEVLASEGITDLEKYSVVPGTKDFLLDFFLD